MVRMTTVLAVHTSNHLSLYTYIYVYIIYIYIYIHPAPIPAERGGSSVQRYARTRLLEVRDCRPQSESVSVG